MTTQEVMNLVKQHVERNIREPVHIVSVVPEGKNGWGVLLEYDGLTWKQIVHAGGQFGDLRLQSRVVSRA